MKSISQSPKVPATYYDVPHFICTLNVEEAGDYRIIPVESGEPIWTPSKIIVDGIELERPSELISLDAGLHIMDLFDYDPTNTDTNICKYFKGCDYTFIRIPNHVTCIGEEAFNHCTGLTSIIIPNHITSIGNNAFNTCRSLASVIIPDSVTGIGEGAFMGCTNLTLAILGNSVTSIGDRAFYGCPNLTSVTIPNSVTSIGEGAFTSFNGGNIALVMCMATVPPFIHTGTFGFESEYIIYVPAASVDAYKTAAGWSDYADHIQVMPE